uniref:Putative structural protein n=1 Tax=viral metagenome TaxID=1070528 RepID=A0A6M3LVL1_9ZZZZ
MGVQNVYMLSSVIPTQVKGGKVIAIAGNFETLAADDIDVIYRLCRVPANAVILQMELNCDAIAGFTDANVGLYDTLEQGGAVKDYDCFLDGKDISAGYALGSEINCLETLPIDEIGDQMYEQAGDSAPTPNGEYDLCLTSDAEITAAGTVAVRILMAVSS